MSGVSAMLAVLHVGRIGFGRRGNAHLRIDRLSNVNRSAPMPNLENLRKQAKLILRWHRDRYYPVAAQIRSGWLGIASSCCRPRSSLKPPKRSRRCSSNFEAAGVAFFQTLRREPWGAKNFIIKDPDGNLLLFAGPAE